MNPGDVIKVHMFDAPVPGGRALEAEETDLTTGQSGYMIASAANGFMNTNPADCNGTPFNFEPEYSSARAQNIIPWGIGPYMINNEFEIGHFEACTSVSEPAIVTEALHRHLLPALPGPVRVSRGGSRRSSPTTRRATGPVTRTAGTAAPNLVTGCDVFFDAIGDLDYDGTPYYPDWPDSVTPDRFPSTFLQQQPTTWRPSLSGDPVRDRHQRERSSTRTATPPGAGCVLPPKGPGNFYPYWTQAKVAGPACGSSATCATATRFGGDAQYGSVGPDTLGAFAGPIRRNPNCY